MRLNQFCLLVTLAFIACCTAFASAEDLIKDKSLKTHSQRKLTDGSRRNLKGSIDEVADEERGFSFNTPATKPKDQTLYEKVVNKVKSVFGFQKKPQTFYETAYAKVSPYLGLEKKPQSWFKKFCAKILIKLGLKKPPQSWYKKLWTD